MDLKYLSISNDISSDLLELLNNNIIGTPGKSMLYQHLQAAEKAGGIEKPFFVNLIKNGSIAGTCCFCSRETMNNGNILNAFYLRYFTFKEQYRRRAGLKRTNATLSSGKLKGEILRLLKGKGLGERDEGKFFHYAYVDPDNERSKKLCEDYNFEPVRRVSTILFSRFFPKKDWRVTKLDFRDLPKIKELIKEYYQGFTMFCFENFRPNSYYLIKNGDGDIVAGVQANPDNWKIHQMPGIKGRIILHFLTRLPMINRMISKNYRFLSFEFIFCKKGYEDSLQQLLESLLAQFKVNMSMSWADKETSLYTTLKAIDLGFVDKINKEIDVDVIAHFVNFDETEKRILKENPAFISATDQT